MMIGEEGTNGSHGGVVVPLMKAGCDNPLENAAIKMRVKRRRKRQLRDVINVL